MTTTTVRPASDRQVALITRLSGEKNVPVASDDPRTAHLILRWQEAVAGNFVSIGDASAVIDWMFTLPRTVSPVEAAAQAVETGVFVLADGTIVKLQWNKAKTNKYTQRWVTIGGERLNEDDARVHGEWEYAPELKGQITEAQRMTLDEAKAFTLRFGQCVRCSRKLKAAESVEQGIGPVCRQDFRF